MGASEDGSLKTYTVNKDWFYLDLDHRHLDEYYLSKGAIETEHLISRTQVPIFKMREKRAQTSKRKSNLIY